MQSTLENLDRRSIEVRNEVAALARAQVLQQLTVLEGLVDTNSRSCKESLEAQNELDYRMHAYLVLTPLIKPSWSSSGTASSVCSAKSAKPCTWQHANVFAFSTITPTRRYAYSAAPGPRYVTALACAEDLRNTVTSLEREVKRELASLAVGLEEAFREHEEQFPGFEQPQQMEEGEVRRDLEEAAEEMEAEGDAP
ncbi:hypothetical protein ACG7TL_007568 [Trametes sanguinea]